MEIWIWVGLFLTGLAVGSFLNLLVFRLGTAESIIWGRSHCMGCRHILEWRELIPVASFVVLGGKCRACRAAISFQYPIVEILTGVIYISVYNFYNQHIYFASPFSVFTELPVFFGYVSGLIFYLTASTLVLAIAIYDFRTSIIAPALFLPFFVLTIVYQLILVFSGSSVREAGLTVLAAVLTFLFFAAFWFFSKGRAMGLGDAEFSATLMLLLGPIYGTIAIVVSFWSGALVGIALILAGLLRMKSKIPFGPLLALGAFFAMFWGPRVLEKYLAFF